MLQRHVYRGAPAPMYAPDGAAAVNAQLRMDRLEAEMRDLTGRVEEYANRLEQLRRRVEHVNGEAELRFGQGSGPGLKARLPPRCRRRVPARRAAAARSSADTAGAPIEDEPRPPTRGPPTDGPTPISAR